VGVQLEVRPLELATLFSDVAKGNFQHTYQRWVGANSDPDFLNMLSRRSASRPMARIAGTIANARIDALTDQIRVEMNQEKRKLYAVRFRKFCRTIFRTCRCGSTMSFLSIAARSALSSCLPPETTTSSQPLDRLESSRRILSRVAWSKSVLFQRLRDLCHGDGPFAADSPGVAI